MRDGFSEGFLTRLAHESHPVDLMCLYLLHGSLERIPGLPAERETLSFAHLSRYVRAAHRSVSGDAHTFSLTIRKKVRGRLYGLEFRLHFVAGEPYADAVIPFGAPVDLGRFMHHLRGHHAPPGAPGDWDFDVFTDVRDLRESVVRFGNGREVWFQVGNHRAEWLRGGTGGRLTNGRARSAWNRGRLVTGRLQGNRFGTRVPSHAGGVMFPDPLAAVADDTPEARAYRRWVARLRDPLPPRVGRTVRPEFGTGRRPR
ncbi:hypothetical protein [Streptomyces sp. VNUA24]|uniref:hypothetical protein n=1 Tax=Streptomyces sp. VNUA24 TaxID=3031131 RepID=UPI0023B79954|nr:hypothetical protein [Streptomyces sp. VNUA24]WEH13252.1 hypothetical protein PYR72_05890 [Streptomyces sp. VNUA24]